MSPNENDNPPENPFEEIIKQLQKFIENLLKNSNFSALNFQEMLDQMMKQMGIDPENLEEVMKELQKNQGFPGFAMGFQITMDPDGNPVINPINPNMKNIVEEKQENKKETIEQRYHEWVEIPAEDGGGWELIVEIPEITSKENIKAWVSLDNVHIESINTPKKIEINIPHNGKIDPKKAIEIDFNNGILVISQKRSKK